MSLLENVTQSGGAGGEHKAGKGIGIPLSPTALEWLAKAVEELNKAVREADTFAVAREALVEQGWKFGEDDYARRAYLALPAGGESKDEYRVSLAQIKRSGRVDVDIRTWYVPAVR